MTRMIEVQQIEVAWLWYPYIPFGNLTIIQGKPGEDKALFFVQLATVLYQPKVSTLDGTI